MIFKLLFIFQIFPLSDIFVQASSYQCIDCKNGRHHCSDMDSHKYPRPDCIIEGPSGYSCGTYKFSRSINSEWAKPGPINDLSRCIPKDLNITETNIEICCVWSKSLGCQILVKPGNDYTCGTCRGHEHTQYDNLKPCPCKGASILYCHAVIFIALFILNTVRGVFWSNLM